MASKKTSAQNLNAGTESLLFRLIATPVLFISFLISLFLIDRQTSGGIFGSSGSKDGYYHSHQRKLARHDITDAFQLRNKVIAAIIAALGFGLAFVAWSFSKAWHAVTPRS